MENCKNDLSNYDFDSLSKLLVQKWYQDNLGIHVYLKSISIVWCCRTIQNDKAILSAAVSDHRIFEVTHNGDSKQMYMSVYTKEDSGVYDDPFVAEML